MVSYHLLPQCLMVKSCLKVLIPGIGPQVLTVTSTNSTRRDLRDQSGAEMCYSTGSSWDRYGTTKWSAYPKFYGNLIFPVNCGEMRIRRQSHLGIAPKLFTAQNRWFKHVQFQFQVSVQIPNTDQPLVCQFLLHCGYVHFYLLCCQPLMVSLGLNGAKIFFHGQILIGCISCVQLWLKKNLQGWDSWILQRTIVYAQSWILWRYASCLSLLQKETTKTMFRKQDRKAKSENPHSI